MGWNDPIPYYSSEEVILLSSYITRWFPSPLNVTHFTTLGVLKLYIALDPSRKYPFLIPFKDISLHLNCTGITQYSKWKYAVLRWRLEIGK